MPTARSRRGASCCPAAPATCTTRSCPASQPGQRYGLRASGPYAPRDGHRFNPAKLLLDPYATALDRHLQLHPSMFGEHCGDGRAQRRRQRDRTCRRRSSRHPRTRGRAVRPRTPWNRTIVYEAHVRGMTMAAPDVPAALRGTCAGIRASRHRRASRAPRRHGGRADAGGGRERRLAPAAAGAHQLLGLQPGRADGARSAPRARRHARAARAGRRAARGRHRSAARHRAQPHERGRCARPDALAARPRQRDLLPDCSPADAARYVDDTGCGNTVALDRPPVLRLALDTLRHYALAAGVDGFRFDLATTLGRRADGFDADAPLLAAIAQDPVLRTLKLIAEPWDVGPHGYRLGAFPAAWGEWNDRFRDGVRRFWRGDAGMTGELATRLAGSPDVFAGRMRPPVAVGQLRRRARRLHARRSRRVRAQAQRGERRAQPRRHRQQPLVEPRRGGRHRRPGDPRGAAARRAQPARHAVRRARHADAGDGRRARPVASAATTTRTRRTTPQTWVDWAQADRVVAGVHRGARGAAPAASGAARRPLAHRRAGRRDRACRTSSGGIRTVAR